MVVFGGPPKMMGRDLHSPRSPRVLENFDSFLMAIVLLYKLGLQYMSHVPKLYQGPSFGLRGVFCTSSTAVDSAGVLMV